MSTPIGLGIGAYSRPYGKLPEIRMENRFFESNPVGAEKVALLSRPGSKLFLTVGTGPIRAMFSQPGVFDGDLFIVSGSELYRYNGVDAPTLIVGVVAGDDFPVMTAVSLFGWQALFITDGVTLQYYVGEYAYSTGTLTQVGIINVAGEDVVEINGVYYKWIEVDINTDISAPADGTVGLPWLVALNVPGSTPMRNMAAAINRSGGIGVMYGVPVVAHPDVESFGASDFAFSVRAKVAGVGGDAITTVLISAAAGAAWGAATLESGGEEELKLSSVPDDVAISDLGTLASHVIAVQKDSTKFFWIRPGKTDIDALDFSSAEAEPDFIVNVVVVGDQFWLFGQSSTEVWYASGDADQPFLRAQGRAFSQGVIPGTAARHQDTIIVTGQDGVVYQITGSPQRISHHGIEEKIRLWRESL